MMIIKWLFFILIVCGVIYYLFPLVNVCGSSMFPTYLDDEIILSTRLFRKHKIKVGDVIVFKHPYEKGRLLIKRVADLYYDKKGKLQSIYFLGDNSSDSYDSRNFGYVLTKDLVSKVLFSRKKIEL